MKSEMLTELLRIYSRLPTGIIVFKEEGIYFINDHLRHVLVLGNLSADECIGYICGILEIPEDESGLLTFFRENSFFTYKEKSVQISARHEAPYDIFVFTLIQSPLLNAAEVQEDVITLPPEAAVELGSGGSEEHAELLKFFDTHRKMKVSGLVLLHGVPLMSNNIVVQPFRNTLVVKIENKQMIAALAGATWTLIQDSGHTVQGEVTHTDTKRQMVFLKKLRRIETGPNQRQAIRYVLEDAVLHCACGSDETQLQVMDISEYALRAMTQSATVLQKLKKMETFKAQLSVEEENITLACRFLKESALREGEAEVVLGLSAETGESERLRALLNRRQIAIIKSIREHTRMTHP